MTVFRHECRQGRRAFWIWTGCIAFLIAVCIFLFPEMEGAMGGVGDVFSSMGAFTEAFGMDTLNFGTLRGFYAVECGNILGIGGALFAAMLGVGALAKEEKNRTAEFLLSHPISRSRVVTEKLLAVVFQILVLNIIAFAVAAACIAAIGEEIFWKELILLHLANLLIQLELAGLCFGLSAFLRRGGLGAGMGIALMLYFLNIVANISEKAAWLKHVTPFAYGEGADILDAGALDWKLILPGMAAAAICVAAAYWQYNRKDLQ